VKKYADKDACIIIAGNKCDLKEEEWIDSERIDQLCETYKFKYF
jgi:GTPase SAR1 family protein